MFSHSIASFIPTKELLSRLPNRKSEVYYVPKDMKIQKAYFKCCEGNLEDDNEVVEVGKVPWIDEENVSNAASTSSALDLLVGYESESDSAVGDVENNMNEVVEGYKLRIPLHNITCKIGDKEHFCKLSQYH